MNEGFLRRLAKEFERFPNMAGKPATDAEINEAEAALGVTFAPAYRELLRTFGAAMVGADPVLGLSQAGVMEDDLWSVVEVTRRFREQGIPGAEEWYVVSVDGAGNPLGADRAGKVWCWDLDLGQRGLVADSVAEYLGGLAENL